MIRKSESSILLKQINFLMIVKLKNKIQKVLFKIKKKEIIRVYFFKNFKIINRDKKLLDNSICYK